MENRNLLYDNEFINTDIDGSDESDETDNETDDESEKVKIIKETKLLIINSKDRDWKGTAELTSDPDTFNYTVKFAPTTDQGEFTGQSQLAHFLTNFRDITEIEFTHVILPNIYVDLETMHNLYDDNHKIITSSSRTTIDSRNIRLPRLTDLPYISLIINEIGTTIEGTNSLLNTTTAVLVTEEIKILTNDNSGKYSNNTAVASTTYEYNNLGKNLIANSEPVLIKFVNITPWKKIYNPNPKSGINILNISFFDPDGKQIKLLDDYLDIDSVGLVNTDSSGGITSFTDNTNTATGSNTLTTTVSNAWATSQNNVVISSDYFATNNSGTNPSITMSTSIDGLTITVSITDGEGFLENDIIRISDPGNLSTEKITFYVKEVSGTSISINTKTYFSPEEYKIGDKLLISKAKLLLTDYYEINNLDTGRLENFLNRDEGHFIIGIGESKKSTNVSTCNMYNQIQIPLSYTLNKTTGKSSIEETFRLKKNVLGIVGGNNSHSLVNLGHTLKVDNLLNNSLTSFPYNSIPSNQNDYYNNKTLIFTSGTSKNQETIITDYNLTNNSLFANVNTLDITPSFNDRYRINMSSPVSAGKLINLNLQNTISLKITTEKKDSSILKY